MRSEEEKVISLETEENVEKVQDQSSDPKEEPEQSPKTETDSEDLLDQSPEAETDPEELPEEADTDSEENLNPEELLAEGKKCLAAGDPNGAVENLQQVCALL